MNLEANIQMAMYQFCLSFWSFALLFASSFACPFYR